MRRVPPVDADEGRRRVEGDAGLHGRVFGPGGHVQARDGGAIAFVVPEAGDRAEAAFLEGGGVGKGADG